MDIGFLSDTGIAIVAVLVVLLFGGSQLPKLARNLGLANKEFRRAHDAAAKDPAGAAQVPPVTPVAQVPPAAQVPPVAPVATPAAPPVAQVPAAPPAPPVAQAPAAPPAPAPADDMITVSKSELAAFLEEREAQARRQANSQ